MMSRLVNTFALMAVLIAPAHADEVSLLPADADAPVLEMWYINGNPPSHPEIIVLADGRMQVLSPEGPLRTSLTIDQLDALMKNLWNVDGLSGVNTETLHRNIQAASTQSGLSMNIEGAGETVLRIRTATNVLELRCPAVGILAVRFPQVKEVQVVAAVQRRLENIRAVATVGGHDEADYIAEIATRAVQDEYGVDVPVSSSDLSMVRALPDGSRFCQFLVTQSDAHAEPVHMISVVETPGHLPRVSIVGGPVTR